MKSFRYSVVFAAIALGSFGQISPVSAATQTERTAVAAAVSKVRGDSIESIRKAAAAAKGLGWSAPTKEGSVGLSGTWKFATSSGESGSATFKSGKITYASGKSLGAFKTYSFMENTKVADAPALVVMGESRDGKWFLPFKKSGTLMLINAANKRQWIALSK